MRLSFFLNPRKKIESARCGGGNITPHLSHHARTGKISFASSLSTGEGGRAHPFNVKTEVGFRKSDSWSRATVYESVGYQKIVVSLLNSSVHTVQATSLEIIRKGNLRRLNA